MRYTFAPPQPDDSAASPVHFRTAAYTQFSVDRGRGREWLESYSECQLICQSRTISLPETLSKNNKDTLPIYDWLG